MIKNIISNSNNVQELGSNDLHAFLSILGVKKVWIGITSLILLLLFLGFNYLIREVDLTSRLAIASVFGRLWVYHGHYDNLMLIFLLLALGQLFITSQKGYLGYSKLPTILIAAVMFTLIIPARFLSFTPYYLGIFLIVQLLIWLYTGLYLAKRSLLEA